MHGQAQRDQARPDQARPDQARPDQVQRERDEVTRQIAGRTVCSELAATARRAGDEPAYSDREDSGPQAGPWHTLTWSQARQQALELAAALLALGVQPGDRVALMLPNRLEHVLADLGALHAGCVPVTFYATLAADQVRYLAGDCGAPVVIIDGAAELARWQQALAARPGEITVIVRDPAAVPAGPGYLSWAQFAALGAAELAGRRGEIARRVAAITPADPATLLYTSGTTGQPKGVIVTHASVLYAVATARYDQRVRWVSYLPLAHIAERMFTLYLAIGHAGHTYFCHDPAGLTQALTAVRPTAFFGVPRVWEKIRSGLQAHLAAEADPARRAAVAAAMETGLRYVRSRQYGESTPPELDAQFAVAAQAVLRPVRALLGLGEAETFLSAAAPLPAEVGEFFAGLGMIILDVYGMTETAGAFVRNTAEAFRLGTVGRAVPGAEVAVAPDGEILTRGPQNTPGYLNLPEQSAALLDPDGWLHTGDVGSVDADGFVRVLDRKKELIITAGGENVSPAMVENLLTSHPLIGQALACGDARPCLVALLTLDAEVAPAWARARGITAGSLAELAADPQVQAEVSAGVQAANAQLARVQQVRAWRLLAGEWTPDSGELTPTLKLRRRIVHARYAAEIDALYATPAALRQRPAAP